MNGVHDMGGMDGLGAMAIEANEPVFHEHWEKRMFGIVLKLMESELENIDEFRHAIERIPAPHYLKSTYYERWLNAVMTMLIEHRAVTREELEACGADPIAPAQPPSHAPAADPPRKRVRARFKDGDRVIARNIHPAGHTRLPRYARGKRGVIHRDWGVYIFADSHAHHAGERPQHVYSVTFEARELWGKDAPRRDILRIDLWEDYLESDSDSVKSAAKKSAAIGLSKRAKKR